MRQLGASVATLLQGSTVLHLSGPVGAGKTTLTQGLLAAAGIEEAVTSPTFSLVEVYEPLCDGMPARIWHFDLYRLSQPEELEFIGIRESFNASDAVVIEWPERGQGVLPRPDIDIVIAYGPELTGGVKTHADSEPAVQSRMEAIAESEAQSLIRMRSHFDAGIAATVEANVSSVETDAAPLPAPRQVAIKLNL